MPHPFDIFQRIYVINLASRADRRAEMAEQLQRIGLAIDSPQVRVFPAIRPTEAGAFSTIGAHGCFMSHLGVLRDARAAGLERILVIEDDLNFSTDFAARAPEVIEWLNAQPWSIFYGGHEVQGALPSGQGCVEIAATLPVQTAHFIAFRGAVIGAMVGYLEAMLARRPGDPQGGPMHVDGAYCWFRAAHPQHRTFIAVPELGHQRSSRTDIHPLRWMDRTPFVRELVALLRRSRNRQLTAAGR